MMQQSNTAAVPAVPSGRPRGRHGKGDRKIYSSTEHRTSLAFAVDEEVRQEILTLPRSEEKKEAGSFIVKLTIESEERKVYAWVTDDEDNRISSVRAKAEQYSTRLGALAIIHICRRNPSLYAKTGVLKFATIQHVDRKGVVLDEEQFSIVYATEGKAVAA